MLKHATAFAILTGLSCGLATASQAATLDEICNTTPVEQTPLGALPPNIADVMRAPASDIPPEVANFFGIWGPGRWDQSHNSQTLAVLTIRRDATTPNSYSALALWSRTGVLKGEAGRYHCVNAKITKTEKGYGLSATEYDRQLAWNGEVAYRTNLDGGLTGFFTGISARDTISLSRAIVPKAGQQLVEAPR
jgi:hypothetical protein